MGGHCSTYSGYRNVKCKEQDVAEGWIVLYREWLDGLYC